MVQATTFNPRQVGRSARHLDKDQILLVTSGCKIVIVLKNVFFKFNKSSFATGIIRILLLYALPMFGKSFGTYREGKPVKEC